MKYEMGDVLNGAIRHKQMDVRPSYIPVSNRRYNIVAEVYYNEKYYYITDDRMVLTAKASLPLPCHPVVDYRKFNEVSMFDVVEEQSEGLEKVIEQIENDAVR